MSEGCRVAVYGEEKWGVGGLDFEICTSPRAAGSPSADACARLHWEPSEEDGDAPQCPQCARVFSLSAGRTPKVLPCQHLCCLECVVNSMHGFEAACAECGASHCLLAVADDGSDFLVEAASSCPHELARRLPTCLILEELLSLLSPPRLPAGQATLLHSSTTSSQDGAPEAGTAGTACPRVAAPLSAEISPHSSSQSAGARAPAAGRNRLASDEFVFDDSIAEPAALSSRFCIRMQKLPANRTAAPADSLPSHTKKPASGESSSVRAAAGKKAGTRCVAAANTVSKRASNTCRQRRLEKNQLRGIDRAQDDDNELLLDVPLSLLPKLAAPDDLMLDVSLSRLPPRDALEESQLDLPLSLLPPRSGTAHAPALPAKIKKRQLVASNARSLSPKNNLHAQQRERLRAQHLGQHQLQPDESAASRVQFKATTVSSAMKQPAAPAAPAPELLVSGTEVPRESKRERKPVMRTKSSDLRYVRRSSIAHAGTTSGICTSQNIHTNTHTHSLTHTLTHTHTCVGVRVEAPSVEGRGVEGRGEMQPKSGKEILETGPCSSHGHKRSLNAAAGGGPAERWEENFKALVKYKARFGHACPPQVGCEVGWWATNQVCVCVCAHQHAARTRARTPVSECS